MSWPVPSSTTVWACWQPRNPNSGLTCFSPIDGLHNDSRMNVAIALTAALYGATMVNHAKVDQLLKDPDSGKIVGVRVRDLLPTEPSGGGDSFVVRTKCQKSETV